MDSDALTSNLCIDDNKCIVLITDKNLAFPGPNILFAAGDTVALTGYERSELIGKTPRILQGPWTDRRKLMELRLTCENNECYEGSLVNYRKDGTPFVMGLAISPIIINGSTRYYFSIQSDVTDREIDTILPMIRDRVYSFNSAIDNAGPRLSNSVARIGDLLASVVDAERCEAVSNISSRHSGAECDGSQRKCTDDI